jgi:hypothetical protein
MIVWAGGFMLVQERADRNDSGNTYTWKSQNNYRPGGALFWFRKLPFFPPFNNPSDQSNN